MPIEGVFSLKFSVEASHNEIHIAVSETDLFPEVTDNDRSYAGVANLLITARD